MKKLTKKAATVVIYMLAALMVLSSCGGFVRSAEYHEREFRVGRQNRGNDAAGGSLGAAQDSVDSGVYEGIPSAGGFAYPDSDQRFIAARYDRETGEIKWGLVDGIDNIVVPLEMTTAQRDADNEFRNWLIEKGTNEGWDLEYMINMANNRYQGMGSWILDVLYPVHNYRVHLNGREYANAASLIDPRVQYIHDVSFTGNWNELFQHILSYTTPRCDEIIAIANRLHAVRLEADGYWGVIDNNGNFVIHPGASPGRPFLISNRSILFTPNESVRFNDRVTMFGLFDLEGNLLGEMGADTYVFAQRTRIIDNRNRRMYDDVGNFIVELSGEGFLRWPHEWFIASGRLYNAYGPYNVIPTTRYGYLNTPAIHIMSAESLGRRSIDYFILDVTQREPRIIAALAPPIDNRTGGWWAQDCTFAEEVREIHSKLWHERFVATTVEKHLRRIPELNFFPYVDGGVAADDIRYIGYSNLSDWLPYIGLRLFSTYFGGLKTFDQVGIVQSQCGTGFGLFTMGQGLVVDTIYTTVVEMVSGACHFAWIYPSRFGRTIVFSSPTEELEVWIGPNGHAFVGDVRLTAVREVLVLPPPVDPLLPDDRFLISPPDVPPGATQEEHIIAHAQNLWDFLERGGRYYYGGDEDPNVWGWQLGRRARVQWMNDTMRTAAPIAAAQAGVIDFSQASLNIVFGVLTGNVHGAAVSLTADRVRIGAEMFVNYQEFGVTNVDAFVVTQAQRGFENHMRDLDTLLVYHDRIYDAGGVVRDVNTALGYLFAWFGIQYGMAAAQMGVDYFERFFTVTPWETASEIAEGFMRDLALSFALDTLHLDSLADEFGMDSFLAAHNGMQSGVAGAFGNTHINRWFHEQRRIQDEMRSWLGQ